MRHEDVLDQLVRYCRKLSLGLPTPQRKFLFDAIYGILVSGSALVSNIARSLNERQTLISTEKRLCYQLRSDALDGPQVRKNYLNLIKEKISAEWIIAVDHTDVQKTGRVMEGVAPVYDGSSRQVGRGLLLLQAEAIGPSHHHLPLLSHLFTPNVEGSNTVLRDVRDWLVPHVPHQCRWVLDRGFDGRRFFDLLKERRYIIRLRKGRLVRADGDDQYRKVEDVATNLELDNRFASRSIYGRRLVDKIIRAGAVRIDYPRDATFKAPWFGTLTVVWDGHRKNPMMLLSNEDDIGYSKEVVAAYYRRWGVEEGIRLMKQVLGLEHVRLLTLRGNRRLVDLVTYAYGFLCLMALDAPRASSAYVRRVAKTFGDEPRYLVYQLSQAVALGLAMVPSWPARFAAARQAA